MSNKEANKENEGVTNAPSLNKNTIIYATDMTEEFRQSIIQIALKAFHSPVNQGKVYQTIANLIRTECEKEFDGGKESNKESAGANSKSIGSGGWSCVVGDAFGSSVTHRMKTYIHFSVIKGVNVLLWKS